MSLSPKEREREFWCERKYRGNTKRCLKECQRRVTNKKETPCKDVYLKTADSTPLWWVELEYTLHIMALCSYSCVGVAAMARNRNKRRSPTSFHPSSSRKPHAGVLSSMGCHISTQQRPKNATLSRTSGVCLTQSCRKIFILKKLEKCNSNSV